MKKKFNTGDTVYYKGGWDDSSVERGVITKIENDRFTVKGKTQVGTFICTEGLYETSEECRDAIRKENEAITKGYLDEITSVKDLVKFMYDNVVASAEDYTDWNARHAAHIKAQELLGIDLDLSDVPQLDESLVRESGNEGLETGMEME